MDGDRRTTKISMTICKNTCSLNLIDSEGSNTKFAALCVITLCSIYNKNDEGSIALIITNKDIKCLV